MLFFEIVQNVVPCVALVSNDVCPLLERVLCASVKIVNRQISAAIWNERTFDIGDNFGQNLNLISAGQTWIR